MPYTEELTHTLEEQIGEIEEDLSRLRAAHAALNGQSVVAPTRTPAVPVKPTRPRTRRQSRHIDPEHVLAAIRGGNHTSPAIAKEIEARADAVLRMLRQLEETGRVTRTGERAKTHWDVTV